jgi:hypothetical protein
MVRVGVVVLLFGFAFLVKYAAARNLVPLEIRLAAAFATGIGMLILGWRLRSNRPGYAVTLQGGGIGVMYLTLFAAARLFHMVPLPLTFGVMVGLVVVFRHPGGAAECGGHGGTGGRRRLHGTGVALHGNGQPRDAVRLLRPAQRRHFRHRLVQGLAVAQSAGLRLHVRHRLRLGRAVLPAPLFFHYRAVSDRLFHLLPGYFRIVCPAAAATAERAMWTAPWYSACPWWCSALQVGLVKNFQYGLAFSAVSMGLIYTGLATALWRRRDEGLGGAGGSLSRPGE